MEQLGVKLILANSPQAKGRVERMNGVLQDRLVKALRLAGIDDVDSANRFLEQLFLPPFNRRFVRAAAQPADVHRPAPRNLEEILSWEQERVVQRDWTVACGGQWYQLDRHHESLSLVRRRVIVRRLRDGREQIVYRGHKLRWRALPARPQPAQPKAIPGPSQPKVAQHKPAASHPWRRYAAGAVAKQRARRRRLDGPILGRAYSSGRGESVTRGDRRRRELRLESRRRRSPARSNRRRDYALTTT